MAQRKLNFNAGPAALPEEVLQLASEAVVDYNGSGLSILEIPHRGKDFDAILEESRELVKELCGLGDDYDVLWLHGGGRLQFCMVPMNFIGPEGAAGYIDSGHWAEEALAYATHYGDVQILASSKDSRYDRLPEWPANIPEQLSYVHLTTNNTIYGTQMQQIPHCPLPLVADMSSDLLSMHRDYSRCALFYAAAQKNIGPAGVTVVGIRRDFAKSVKNTLPPMLDYSAHIKEHSALNTPPVFAIYCSLLMLRWTKQKGMDAIERDNRLKAALLYNEIDRNPCFEGVVKNIPDRSLMNVCFNALNINLEKGFLKYCEEQDITGIKGHRAAGGFRASLYNAVTVPAVEKLVAAMKDFEKYLPIH